MSTGTATKSACEGKSCYLRRLFRLGLVLPLLALPLLIPAQGAIARSRAANAERSSPCTVASYEVRVANAINAVRKRHGLRRLRLVPGLMRSAGSHSLQMARSGFFSHNSADGTSFFVRLQRFYGRGSSRYWSAGENLLWATGSIKPRQIVGRWLASPEHRAVLLSPRWLVLGVGVVRSTHGPGVYEGNTVLLVTADFAVRR